MIISWQAIKKNGKKTGDPMFWAFKNRLIFALMVLLVPVSGWCADADDLNLERPLEYFVDQPPGVAMLIRTVGFETEFESRIYTDDGALLKRSRLPPSRMGAVYQLVDAFNDTRKAYSPAARLPVRR
jgi:hypothetical protein